MDSTRTKDATELLKKINDLQTELAWNTAEDEAEAQKEALDDKAEAYSQFQTIASEDLEALLKDATNFTVDVNDVLKMSFNDMMQWLSDSVEQFSISLDESQQQMLDSWEDTFRQMKGITGQYGEDLYGLDRTYGEVPNVLETKESFMGRMMQTDQYLNAISDEERWQMLYQWAELYDNWVAAQKNEATYSHEDDWLGLGTNGDAGKTTHGYSYYADGSIHSQTGFATKEEAQAAADAQKRLIAHGFPREADDKGELTKIVSSFSVYKSGGLVDYTGPAWVDGTPMRPEAFLSAEDTAMIRTMIDSLSRVMHNPYMTMINPADFGGSSSTIGDINVTINQAEITDDRSIEDLANRVGEALVDELAKTGFNTGRFSF